MVDHVVHDGYAPGLADINEHEPRSRYNENTRTHRVWCEGCGWIGRGYSGRWAEKADEQWAIHAADIAMRREPTGEEQHVNCHCASCAQARRRAEQGEGAEQPEGSDR